MSFAECLDMSFRCKKEKSTSSRDVCITRIKSTHTISMISTLYAIPYTI